MTNPSRYPTYAQLAEKFWQRVDVRGPDECWEWKLFVSKDGYARWRMVGTKSAIHFYKTNRTVHRLAWYFTRGPIPPPWTIDHECRNTICCNPAHLRLMTLSDNAKLNGNSQRTHCPRGHEYAGANVYYRTTRGGRMCRACAAVYRNNRKLRLQGAHA